MLAGFLAGCRVKRSGPFQVAELFLLPNRGKLYPKKRKGPPPPRAPLLLNHLIEISTLCRWVGEILLRYNNSARPVFYHTKKIKSAQNLGEDPIDRPAEIQGRPDPLESFFLS
jgi:hypothetical protein